jgi:hypothetical protein
LKLIFQNSRGEERVIAEPTNREEISKEIDKFLDDHNFKSYYTRVWEENGRLIYDVGSHTEFFVLEGMTFEEYTKKKPFRQNDVGASLNGEVLNKTNIQNTRFYILKISKFEN